MFNIKISYSLFKNLTKKEGGARFINRALKMNPGTVIGLIGENGSGKGTFVKHFQKLVEKNQNTFKHLKFSDPLAETLKLWNLPLTRTNFQKLPVAMEKTYGLGCLTKVMEHRIKNTPEYFVAVDGVRWKSDIEMLHRLHESKIRVFSLIYITTKAEIRYQRMKDRKEKAGEECMSWEQFTEEENALTEKDIKTLGVNYAHYIIDNNGTEEEFSKKIEEVFAKLLVKFW